MLSKSFLHKPSKLAHTAAATCEVHDCDPPQQPSLEMDEHQLQSIDVNSSTAVDFEAERSNVSTDSSERELGAILYLMSNLNRQVHVNRTALLSKRLLGQLSCQLETTFRDASFETKRELFLDADALLVHSRNTDKAPGTIQSRKSWNNTEFENSHPDAVCLSGLICPAHRVVRQAAQEIGTKKIALDDGCSRSRFIAYEAGRNIECNYKLQGVTQ